LEVSGKLVIARRDTSPILETTEHALDQIAPFVGGAIEGMEVLAGGIVGDDGHRAALGEELSQAIGIVSGVGGAQPRWWQRAEERQRGADVAELALGYFERDEAPERIADGVDFRRSAAARAADRLRFGPPFPPAAERCALALVLSIA
jgi:hypothetical protein